MMKRNHIMSAIALCWIATILPAIGDMPIQKTNREMVDIVNSKKLTKGQKLDALSEYFGKDSYWRVLCHLDRVDKTQAQKIALSLFRKENTSRVHKYQLGQYLLRAQTPDLDRKSDDPPGFITEYRQFLIDAILNGGEEEFNRSKTYMPTAVGEYAGLAGGINGPVSIHFSDVADKRVIPILIQCLSAPDHVYPKEQGSVIRGKPGKSTGRNMPRQGIPLALARMDAHESIPSLERIVASHHDYYLRCNAAYALGRLSNEKNAKLLESHVKNAKDPRFLFYFGNGLLARGEYDGIQYFAFKYSEYSDETSLIPVLYMVEERLPLIKKLKDKRTAMFYGQALEWVPLRNFFLSDSKFAGYKGRLDKIGLRYTDEALSNQQDRIVRIYKGIIDGMLLNDLIQFEASILEIRNETKNPRIKAVSEQYLNKLAK